MGFLSWEIRSPPLPGESQLRQSRATQPTVHTGCLIIHNPLNSDMDYGIFNVRTDVNACDCTLGCTDTLRDSALKVDSWRKIPCRTGESNLRRQRALPTELHPHSTCKRNHASPMLTGSLTVDFNLFSHGN